MIFKKTNWEKWSKYIVLCLLPFMITFYFSAALSHWRFIKLAVDQKPEALSQYLPPAVYWDNSTFSCAKEPLLSSLWEHYLREHGTWYVQMSCKEKRVFSCCFFLQEKQNLPFFLKQLLLRNGAIKKRWKEKNSHPKFMSHFFQRLCLWCCTDGKKKNHERDGKHQHLRPKLTDEKPWLKLLCGT